MKNTFLAFLCFYAGYTFCSAAPPAPSFEKLRLSDKFYAEGAYYADFNKDGKLDVVAGPFWYAGPDFQKIHEITPPKSFDPNDYSNNFLTYTGDFNADGWPDVLYLPFPGTEASWYENPGPQGGNWKQHSALKDVGNESPVWADIDGDGRPELIYNTTGYLGYATYDPAKPDEPWVFHAVTPKGKYQRFSHGVGVGDINGDGRLDILEAEGWWEHPAQAEPGAPWIKHPHKFAEAAAQMYAYDVDGDGLNDVITVWNCHLYGLVWQKQIRDAKGVITWKQNVILPSSPDLKSSDLRISQLHAFELVDMNGDGLKDILTGKRYWAHGAHGDAEPDAPAVVYWFELQRDKNQGVRFIPHRIDDDSGVGTQVTGVDVSGDGIPDVVASNKKGTFLHLSRQLQILPKAKREQPVPFSGVRLEGELGTRYAAAVCNILTRTDRYPPESFAASASSRPGALWWDWPGDQIGRWLSVAHVAESSGWMPIAGYRRAVAEAVFPHQTAEGYFGKPGTLNSEDARIPSGNGFALRGLLDAYSDTRDPRYLDSARKLARYFEAIAPNWEKSQIQFFNQSGQKQSFEMNAPGWDKREAGKLHEFYGHCIDGLVALYEQGGDAWALDFAKRLAKNAGRTPHTHHSLSLCRGLVDLARVTGDAEYLEKVEDYLAWCRGNQLATGGLPEAVPKSPQDEGCGLADWIVVNAMMHQLTGVERYLDDAEHTLVNHFFMNQFHTGGFGHRTFSQEIVGGKLWQGWEGKFGSENPGCCSFWGAWALGELGRYVVTQSKDKVSVNLYPAAEIAIPERGLRLEMSGDFPRTTNARIRVDCEKPQTFALALRIPPWARSMRVKLDGIDVQTPRTGRRVLLARDWRGVADVEIEFAHEVRTVPWPVEAPQGVAVFDGPLCFGLLETSANLDLPWAVPIDVAGRVVLDGEGRPQVREKSGGKVKSLEPINAGWLTPDVNNPARRRILFQTQ